MLEYAIVFVLTSTYKYAYVRYHRIYTEIRSYLDQNLEIDTLYRGMAWLPIQKDETCLSI